MKVHIETREDLAIGRVIKALKQYAPAHVEFVGRSDAELIIMHITGRIERIKRQIEKVIIDNKKQYAIIQYCLRSTQKKSALDWIPIWENAELVCSYLDLALLTVQDGGTFPSNFYHTPFGFDSNILKPQERSEESLALTTGRD